MRSAHRLIFTIVFFTAFFPVYALDIAPFYTRNENPLIRIYGKPVIGATQVLPEGELVGSIVVDITNHAAIENTANEQITLDGETYKVAGTLRYGLGNGLELDLEVPYISQREGSLDNFIEDWHDLFGLSNSIRHQLPAQDLRYTYVRNGVTRIDIQQPSDDLGDISLVLAYQLNRRNKDLKRPITIRLGLKLPTGDAVTLSGSGGTDLSLHINASDSEIFSKKRISLYGNAGVLLLGGGDVLADIRRDAVAFGGFGLVWQYNEPLSFSTQLDVHSSYYKSDLETLGAFSEQLSFGWSYRLLNGIIMDFGMVQNVFTDTTPDVVFHFRIKSGL